MPIGIAIALLPFMTLPRTALLAAVVLTAALGTSQTAKADGFYGTVDSSVTRVSADAAFDESYVLPDSGRARIGIGIRVSSWALEAWTAVGEIDGVGYDGYDTTVDVSLSGIDGKLFKHISPRTEAYVRGRISRGSSSTEAGYDYRAGRGLGFAFGLQYNFTVKSAVKGAVFVELGYDFYRLHSDYSYSDDVSFGGIAFGFSLGTDT